MHRVCVRVCVCVCVCVRVCARVDVTHAVMLYYQGLWGKWHLGNMRVENSVSAVAGPGSQGFDDWMATVRSVDMVDPNYVYDSNLANHKHCDRLKGQSAQIVMRRAVSLIQQSVAEGVPFFATTWFHEPHTPIQATEKHLNMYAGVKPRGKIPGHGITYWACLTAMDEAIGNLRSELRRLRIENDTLIWFTSDNGATVGGGINTGGLQGQKFNTLEGGIRVPSVLEWPGVIRPGRVVDTPISVMDMYPTILDIVAGSAFEPHKKYKRVEEAGNILDGISVRGIITEEDNYPIELNKMIPIKFRDMYGMIDRNNGWKWGVSEKGGTSEMLSDVAKNPFEERTGTKNDKVFNKMKTAFKAWCRTTVLGC